MDDLAPNCLTALGGHQGRDRRYAKEDGRAKKRRLIAATATPAAYAIDGKEDSAHAGTYESAAIP